MYSTQQYSWNTAKVGLKHQPINQSINPCIHFAIIILGIYVIVTNLSVLSLKFNYEICRFYILRNSLFFSTSIMINMCCIIERNTIHDKTLRFVTITYMPNIIMAKWIHGLIDWLIGWCLRPTLAVFQIVTNLSVLSWIVFLSIMQHIFIIIEVEKNNEFLSI
jgi:hypothetical protein